jgi:hypothetical protein
VERLRVLSISSCSFFLQQAGIVVGSVVLAGVVVAAVIGVKLHAANSAATMATLRMNPVHQ